MRRVLMTLTALGLLFAAGCSAEEAPEGVKDDAGGQIAAPARGEVDSKKQKAENLIADCMKKQGFQYTPHVSADGESGQFSFAGQLSVLEPADEVRKFRQKYGFGVMSRLVYPNDPAVAVPDMDPSKNPNNAIREGLDRNRRKAYDLALDGVVDSGADGQHKGDVKEPGCSGKAYSEVFGDTTPDKATLRARQRAYGAFQADPQVVAAAQQWADCLRGQGYKVQDARPGAIEVALATVAMDGGLPAGPGDSAEVPADGAATAAAGGSASVQAADASAGLQREIKAALADLDCRTGYAALVRAEYAKVLRDGDGDA